MRYLRILLLSFVVITRGVLVYSQTSFVSTKDATINNLFGSGDGTSTTMSSGRALFFGSTYYTIRSVIEFDFSSIPSNAIIKSATLKLKQQTVAGSPTIYAARLNASWVENTITWANQPAYETSDQITSSSVVSGWHTVDVKNHVQKMVAGVVQNNGWILFNNNETLSSNTYKTFYTKEHGTPTYRPELIIDYYIPITVSSATITHESGSGASDGSVSPVLAYGPGGLSYKWFNSAGTQISTSLTLTNRSYGWYGLEVSSTNTTDKFYYAFIVGLNCEEVDIPFNPGPNYVDDALLNKPQPTTNYGNYGYFQASGGLYNQVRSAIKFRVWFDNELIVNEATLKLTRYSSTGASANFKKITSQWYENTVTHSILPSTIGSAIPLFIGFMTPVETSDIIDNVNEWKADNSSNYGLLFELAVYSGSSYPDPARRFYSSDNGTSSNRPKIDFKVAVSNPTAPHYCNQSFAKLERKLTGVRYKPYLSHFYFFYDEEYDVLDGELNYKIFEEDDRLTPVMDSGSVPIEEIEYGDNRYAIDVSALSNGIYILEVINNKEEKYYLRFIKN